MKFRRPDINYELTFYNLDCEVPLSFEDFYIKDDGLTITIDNIEKSPPFALRDIIETPKLFPQYPKKLVTIAFPGYEEEYEVGDIDDIPIPAGEDDEEFIKSMKSQVKTVAQFLLTTLRLFKSRRIWMTHFYNLIYSNFFPRCAEYYIIAAKLENLPPEVKFPDELKDKIWYYSSKLLFFKGVVTQGEKEKLLALSDNKQYRTAIDRLSQWSHYVKIKPYILKTEDIELIKRLKCETGYFQVGAILYLEGVHGRPPRRIDGPFYVTERKLTEIQHNIDLALSYYMRAHDEPFYREDTSLIQLFIALEALFVRKEDDQSISITERLRNRVSTLLGEDPNKQKRIQETLKKLYGLRGDIVHGSEMPNPDITHDLLQELFEYVRLSILYFIGLATREKKDIINILDMTIKLDDKKIKVRELRKEIRGHYPPELHKVLQFNGGK